VIEKLHYRALVKYQCTVKSQKFRTGELAVNLHHRVYSGGLKVEMLIVDYCSNTQAVVTAGAVSCCGYKKNSCAGRWSDCCDVSFVSPRVYTI
jgi:hypothetical protein